jgi:hypothetical protein
MDKRMKIFNIDFRGHWPVPHGLIVAAYDEDQARKLAVDLLTEENLDPETMEISEVFVEEPKIIFFESGQY